MTRAALRAIGRRSSAPRNARSSSKTGPHPSPETSRANRTPSPDATTSLVFDRIDDARRYCEGKVKALPQLRCEIYDAEGLADPPLLVITHADFHQEEDSGSFWSRRRKWIAIVLFLMAPSLIRLDMRRANSLVLPTFLAFNCILLALRFLYWDFGVKHRERERQKRLEAHRVKERAAA